MKGRSLYFPVALFAALSICSQATLRPGEVEKLTLIETPAPEDEKTEIREIQRRLGELEKSVRALQAQQAPAAEDAPLSAPPAATPPALEQWRQLKEGMSKDEVRNLLGPPGDIDKEEYNEHWFYPDRGDGSGTVDFGQYDDVLSWKEPQE